MSYSPAFTKPLAPAMVSYGPDSSQGVRPSIPSFSTPTGQTQLTPGFSSMLVSFMTQPAASYVDGVNHVSGQEVVCNFPLVLVSGDVKLVDQPGSVQNLFLDQSRCHECVSADRAGTTFGSSLVRVESLCPELGLDRTSEQSGSPVLGPILRQVQSNEGDNDTGSSLVCSQCFDQIDKGMDGSLLGQVNVLSREPVDSVVEPVVCSNPDLEGFGSEEM
ncbi:hypothetical protein V6N11_048870 [Hibiscus sabdariffa]|uniref:Uncharacterized protein n=1 Tax=Hibiscus sabdariffa TaxID=183260 RepID=A0ABR2PWJ4_9ROSI